ncbi:UDP-3-O-acyl-N-acetylglucosamine deacetylase [Rhodovulum euryhalinum]|uniref:UDP-3-O-acyl-N-acetylglucosamine deacetylase n=1 Tax=Rhodovulum euryhalinum TaxID=35805 RepID=A0A4R2KS28_9RHOB|nr:UDP-3-O-acyl-N-acetylglucosamine deacetylase [Rhodovulum euryhalinum]TCO72948.1 UDP-3-O-[3-hydroxymyristoyl] N-acetylglucosamine deacetylase [Rhodovulum euryhalinum]
MQTTLKSPISFSGTGLHTGRAVRMTVHPASAEYGIWFRRTDLDGPDAMIPARWDVVVPSRLCTKLANGRAEVSTVEHLMAALAGCGIHNALIEINGPEVPVMDGSAQPFVEGFLSRGLRRLAAPTRALRILEPVEVTDGDAMASLAPADTLEIDFEIDFADRAIGHQAKRLNMANGAFVRELCDSRTFCRNTDVAAMRAAGLALGGTFRNAVVVEGDKVLSPGGFRHADEAVRHKMLDALGDLALAGAPILGRYRGERAGHALTNRLLRALFARPGAFRLVTCTPAEAARLPGSGVDVHDLKAVA